MITDLKNGNGTVWVSSKQGCGSGSGLDPNSIGSVDPDPDSVSGSGSRRAKITHRSRKIFKNFMF
jgi:hypothetical protein